MNVKSKIKDIMEEKEISVLKLSEDIDMTYSNTHGLVNKDYLDRTSFASIVRISKAIDCDITELFEWED